MRTAWGRRSTGRMLACRASHSPLAAGRRREKGIRERVSGKPLRRPIVSDRTFRPSRWPLVCGNGRMRPIADIAARREGAIDLPFEWLDPYDLVNDHLVF